MTVAVNSFKFYHAVFVGDLISCYSEFIKVGQTSITVRVEVYVQRNLGNVETVKVTEAELTFVVLDENRKPCVIPSKLDSDEM